MLYNGGKAKKGSKAVTAVLSVLAVLLAAAAAVTWMAFNGSDDLWKKQSAEPSKAIEETAVKSAVTGKEVSFSADEAGGYLNYLLQKHRSGLFSGTGYAALKLAGGDTADIYVPVVYKGKTFGVTVNFVPSYDEKTERLVFKVKSLHVGRLPVKPSWALKAVKDKLPSGFTAEGGTVYYDMPAIEASVGAVSAEVRLTQLKAEALSFKLRAKSKVSVSFAGG
jgi:hypothetical protein